METREAFQIDFGLMHFVFQLCLTTSQRRGVSSLSHCVVVAMNIEELFLAMLLAWHLVT
jgi:hypothetical protein